MLIVMAGLLGNAVAPPIHATDWPAVTATGMTSMLSHLSVECQYQTNKTLRLFRHKRGFTAYTLEPGSQWILMLNMEEKVENTSIRLARELVLALRTAPPLHQALDAGGWIEQSLYKFGGPDLQFESQSISGVLEITELQENGVCHGKVRFVFKTPSIDRTGEGEAVLDVAF